MAKAAGFTQVHGAAETPQHQGQIERFNRTAKGLLFVWIGQNWEIAVEHWHDVGLAACEEKYMRSDHRTLGMPPDIYVLGRMRAPALRMTATLNHLLAGPNAPLPGYGNYSDAFARPTMAQQTRVGEFNAACVALQLETLDLHSQAESATVKAQKLSLRASFSLPWGKTHNSNDQRTNDPVSTPATRPKLPTYVVPCVP
jgi:hypothetical protein